MTKKNRLVLLCLGCLMLFNAVHAEPYSAVAFDFGGVVAKASRSRMAAFFTTHLCIDESELRLAFGDMRAYVAEGGSEKLYWEEYARSRGLQLPDDWFNQFENVLREAIVEIPGTIELVKELQRQGYRTAMLSDVTQYQAMIIRKMGYYDLFYPVVLSCDLGVEKPNPEAFHALLRALHLPGSAVLFIDDKEENVEAARREGIDSIIFINPEQIRKELEARGLDLQVPLQCVLMGRLDANC